MAFANIDWTVLTKLSGLPLLNSLRILLYNMHIVPNDQSFCVIAEIASKVSDFSFCFRRRYYPNVDAPYLPYLEYTSCIDHSFRLISSRGGKNQGRKSPKAEEKISQS